MASRCIFGSQATGSRPCGWFPLGSLSKVWLCLCYIFISLVGVCADDINSDGLKVHFGFPGNWFWTLRMIPTGIAMQSVMVSLRYCYRFGWCLPWRHQEWRRQGAFWVSWQLVCDLAGDSHEDRQAKCDGLFVILLSLWLVSSLTSVSDGVKVHFGFPGNWFAIFLSLCLVSALTSSRVMASRCILGSQATGLRPCGWCEGPFAIFLSLLLMSALTLWRVVASRRLVVDLVGDSHEDRWGKCDGPFAIFQWVWLVSAWTSSRLTTSRCIFGARQSVCDQWQWFWVTLQSILSCLIHEGWRVFIVRTTMFTIVNRDQLLRQIKQNSKHNNNGFNQWLEILPVGDLPAKLRKSWKNDLKFSTNSE